MGKAILWPRTTTKNIDQHYPWGSQLAYSIMAKASTQGQSIKDPRVEKPKVQAPESTIPRFSNLEPSIKAWRKKKKNCHKQEQQD